MRPKVYVTYQIADKPLNVLREHYDVSINESGQPLTKEELIRNLQGMNGALCMFFDRIDRDVIDEIQGIKVLANYAVGYNNIDVEYAASKGVIVTNTPGVLTDATADLAWALLFAVARRVVDADRYTRGGQFIGATPTLFLGKEITGRTLGVIGAGRIGSNFARKAKGFDMKILYTKRTPDLAFEEETGGVFTDKETLLRESDFVSVHVPLTAETRHLIGLEEFKMMKRSAVFINTSRGPVVDEKALVEALKAGYIWGAGLDVYENEPAIEPELFSFENVVLLPHIGSATEETREKMAEIAVANVLAVLPGDKAPNCVNGI